MKEELKELIEYKELNIEDYNDHHELYDALEYDGSVHELIDGMIDIYHHDLRVWAVENYGYVEQAIEEGLADGTDYHASIQAGQYLAYSEDAWEAIEEVYEELTEELEEVS